jgi:diguanylate cyclase (GGDEF)-like protein/PAS domain S-box-containing protein
MTDTVSKSRNRLDWTGNFSLRTQLIVGFAVLVALTLTAGFAAYLGQQRSVDAVGHLLAIDGRIAELSMRSSAAMLKARRAEKDFLLFQREFGFDEARSRYATLLRANVADVRRSMAEVRDLDHSPELDRETRTIEQAIAQYETVFLKTVAYYGQLGYVTTGVEGRLRRTAHEIEAIVSARRVERLMIDLLAMRRHEKDFIARGQDKYAEAFRRGIDRFNSDVGRSALPVAVKGQLRSLITDYRDQFQQYVELSARSNAETAVYLSAAHTVEPLLEDLYTRANQSALATQDRVQKEARATTWTIVAATLLAALLGVAIARVVSRGVARPVEEARDFAKRVAQGNLTTRLRPRGRHEFETLAVALNQMTQALQESRVSLEHRAAELAVSNQALQDEIVVRRHTEEELRRIVRARDVMAKCNHILVHAASEPDLVDAMCRTVVERGGYRMAWIGYAQRDEAKSVLPVAQAGFDERYLDFLRATVTWGEDVDRNGIAGTVVRTGQPVVVRNICEDPRFALWRDEAVKRGYASVLGLPLRDEDGTFGNLSLYSAEPDAFDEAEVELLTELSNDIAYGITSLRTVAARRLAERVLRLRQRAVEASVNAILITDATRPDNPVEYVNPAFERITGYSAGEVHGHNARFLQREDRDQSGLQEIRLALAKQTEGHAVVRNYRKDGSLFWNDLHIAPVRDELGEVTHFVGILNDITEAQLYQQELEHQANHDVLTGLPNRNLLTDRMAQAVAHARRKRERLAIVCLDLDRFKLINDSFGHLVGDALLKTVAARLRATLRESDTVARLGGDEFMVILSGLAHAEDAGGVAQKLLAALARPVAIEAHDLHVTASIGISIYPEDGDSTDALLRNADTAMYRAKEQGRDRLQFYAREMGVQVQERVALENALRQALQRQEFELHYQPKVNLESGQIRGVEALIRWRHRDLGLVAPNRFIPVAEETGLIVPIGEWVLRTACAQAKAWRGMGYSDLSVAVNLSARQFQQQNVPELVRRLLAHAGLDPQYLELELTESMLMQDSETLTQTLRELKAIGVVLSLDDFGTGFSSLSYLRRFPFDIVKIDQTFVRGVIDRVDDASLTRAIIAMARSLSLTTVAEGVETEAQMGFLRAHQCDAFQGYYFSRPVQADQMTALLAEGKHLPVDRSSRDSAVTTLLLVDDNENDLALLVRSLQGERYRILSAANARQALELLALHRVGVVVADDRMPGMSGVEFLSRVKGLYPHSWRIMLTGHGDLQSVTAAVNEGGVQKFLTKPWDDALLRAHVADGFRRYQVAADTDQLTQQMKAAGA